MSGWKLLDPIIYLSAQMKISKGPNMGGRMGEHHIYKAVIPQEGELRKVYTRMNMFQIQNVPTTHWPIPCMAKFILIRSRPKNFPKTIFWHMTAYSLVPDYMASNRETATCTVTAVRPANLKQKKFSIFWTPTRFINMFRGVQQWILP
jgi:hypothetical protein